MIEQLSTTALERADATAVQIHSLTHRNRFTEAIALGIDQLRELGITVPAADRLPVELDHQFEDLYRWLDHTDAADDLTRPEITDPALIAAVPLANAVLPTVYFIADHARFAWLSQQALRIWIEHGPGPTMVCSASHAAAAVVLRGDYAAYRGLRRILALGEARGYEPGASHARFQFAVVSHWFEPIENSVQAGQQARDGLIAGGDLANAGIRCQPIAASLLDCVPTLDAYVAEVEADVALVRRIGSELIGQWLDSYRWLAGVLRGESSAGAGEAVPIDRYADNPLALFLTYLQHAVAAAIFGDPVDLVRHTEAAMPLLLRLPRASTRRPWPACCAGWPSPGRPAPRTRDERGGLLSELDEVIRWLATRAADAPAAARCWRSRSSAAASCRRCCCWRTASCAARSRPGG